MRSDQETGERKQCKCNMHEVFLFTLVVTGVRSCHFKGEILYISDLIASKCLRVLCVSCNRGMHFPAIPEA